MASAGDTDLARKVGMVCALAGGVVCVLTLLTLPAAIENQVRLSSATDSSHEDAWFDTIASAGHRYGGVVTAAHLFFGVVLMIAGVAFSRRRPWSRPALELTMWGALVYTGITGAARHMWLRSMAPSVPGIPDWYHSLVRFESILSLRPLFLLALVSIILLLRSSTMRKALEGKGSGEA